MADGLAYLRMLNVLGKAEGDCEVLGSANYKTNLFFFFFLVCFTIDDFETKRNK